MSRRRVVVTGLGCVSPVGNTVAEAWSNVLAGKSGIDLITKFDASAFSCKIAGEVRNLDLEAYISAKEARAMDTFIHYGIAAAVQAVALNGAQVSSLLEIVQAVASGQLPRESALGMIRIAFGLTDTQAADALGPVGKTWFAPPPVPNP